MFGAVTPSTGSRNNSGDFKDMIPLTTSDLVDSNDHKKNEKLTNLYNKLALCFNIVEIKLTKQMDYIYDKISMCNDLKEDEIDEYKNNIDNIYSKLMLITESPTISPHLGPVSRKLKIFKEAGEPDFENEIAVTSEYKAVVTLIFYHTFKQKVYILVQKRSSVMSHPGEVCGIGGNVEAGETWLEGLARECLEESGINLFSLDTTIWHLKNNFDNKKLKTTKSICFVAKLDYKHSFVAPTHSEELDKSFYDETQGNIKNYHKWVHINDLLNGKGMMPLYYFRQDLFVFLKTYREKESKISGRSNLVIQRRD
jgi:8-oxo-dGTP pyrophosphatase MutT (NUDIX family)